MQRQNVWIAVVSLLGLLPTLLPAHAAPLRLDFSSELHRSTGPSTTEYVTAIEGWLTFDPAAPLISSSDGGIGRGSSRAPLDALEFTTFGTTFRNTAGQLGEVVTVSDSPYCLVDGVACYRDMVKFWLWAPQADPAPGLVGVIGFSLELFGGYGMLDDGDEQPTDLSFIGRAQYARVLFTAAGPLGIPIGSPDQAAVAPHVVSVPEPGTGSLISLGILAALGITPRAKRTYRSASAA
jgi:hypothetical protein